MKSASGVILSLVVMAVTLFVVAVAVLPFVAHYLAVCR